MNAADLEDALRPVADALETLGVAYFIAGSLASATHGVPRASLDVDLVADLQTQHVEPLVALLADAYYVSEPLVRTAVRDRRSFNLIHLTSMFKVDVFVSKGRPVDREAQARARLEVIGQEPGARRYPVESAEDTVLSKLEWFRAGGEVSERQWLDVVGILRTQAHGLDEAYLERWAATIGVGDLFERAVAAARP